MSRVAGPARCCSRRSGRLGGAAAAGGGRDALSYGVSFATTRSHQLARGGSGGLSLRHFGLVLFIPWRVGAEESGAAKNGLRAQHLNNALTECLKWGRVNLLCHPRARASFSLTRRAGAMLRLLDRIGMSEMGAR